MARACGSCPGMCSCSGNVCSGASGSDSAKPVQPVQVGQIPAMLRFLCLLLKAEFTLTGSSDTRAGQSGGSGEFSMPWLGQGEEPGWSLL